MFKKTVISLLFSIISLNASTAQSKNNNRSAIPDTWQKIVMAYYHDFPCKERCQQEGVTGCLRTRNRMDKWTLRCQEQVNLLRPGKVVSIWQQVEKKKGYVTLKIPEFSLKNVHARIIATDQIHENHFSANYAGHISGIFKRHIMTVNKYAFKNMKTGSISLMNVTPTHRFYVKNKNSFIPVSQITTADTLINSMGKQIKLVCLNKDEKDCDFSEKTASEDILPAQVYGLEVHGRPCYFAGKENILVHNICALAQKLQRKIPHLIVTKGFFRWKRAYLRLHSFDDINSAWRTLRGIDPRNVLCETCSLLAACEYTGKKLKISSLEILFRYKSNCQSGRDALEEYCSYFSHLLDQFGAGKKIAKNSEYLGLQQLLGEDYCGASLVVGGRHIGLIEGRGYHQYSYVKAYPDRLSKESFHDDVLTEEDWGLQNGHWDIDCFVRLTRRS